MDENVTKDIGILRGNLDNQALKIKENIGVLNESLSQLPYNRERDTYMELEAKESKHKDVIDFKDRLRTCTESSLEMGMTSSESRYKKYEEFIEKLKAETNWSNRVVDVRNWFDFVAHEKRRGDNKKVAYYEDSSGQSGGEKSKLAFTILVAAIAYQYNLNPKKPRPDRFNFVMVDEMFTKVDDQYSEYALELFKQFNLQLLIVAPFDAKARITEPFVDRYLLVDKNAETKRSKVFQITAERLQENHCDDEEHFTTPRNPR
jgi:uncharacterized protein YPO0396